VVKERNKQVLVIGIPLADGWPPRLPNQTCRPSTESTRGSLAGGIVGILYVGALIIPGGESVNSFFQLKDGIPFTPPFKQFHISPGVAVGSEKQDPMHDGRSTAQERLA
jgi:hypothetical protein